MPCYHPIKGYRSKTVNENGKRTIVFNRAEGYIDLVVTVPCGKCIGCRLEHSKMWASRCLHEASLYDQNSFLTLTYNDENVPSDFSLNVKDFQSFMKRLRREIYPKKVRFFHCGEYGENTQRPHYHAILFGLDFADKQYHCKARENTLYTSDQLNNLWGLGYCTIGAVTFESCAYVARYITKKITGDQAEEHYKGRKPEYVTMSRRPGIGQQWLEQYQSDVYPRDEVIIRGQKCKPPRYYDKQLEKTNPKLYESIKTRRANYGRECEKHPDSSLRRLNERETVKKRQVSLYKRDVDSTH